MYQHLSLDTGSPLPCFNCLPRGFTVSRFTGQCADSSVSKRSSFSSAQHFH